MSDNEGIKTDNDDDDDNNVDRQGRSWPAGFGVRAPPPLRHQGATCQIFINPMRKFWRPWMKEGNEVRM